MKPELMLGVSVRIALQYCIAQEKACGFSEGVPHHQKRSGYGVERDMEDYTVTGDYKQN